MARILVVDDSPDVRLTLQKLLGAGGHGVTLVASARGLEQLLAEQRHDLLMLDIVMPDRDGLETLMSLRKAAPSLPVIMMSGGSRQFSLDYLSMADGLGATATLAKPFDGEILLGMIDRLLAGQ